MHGMQETVLGPGGFAMMPSKRPHWFTCTAKEECLMFVSFDRPYDIVWLKPNKIAPRIPVQVNSKPPAQSVSGSSRSANWRSSTLRKVCVNPFGSGLLNI
jgi:hypothetical protein